MTKPLNEQGAFLILWAFLLLALLTMVAIVVDLGQVRETRRQAQRTADLAAISAGEQMAGGDLINACKAAVTYIRTNASLASLSETCSTNFANPCDPTAPAFMTTSAGGYVVMIQSPVLDSEIEEPNYLPDPLTGKRVLESDGLPCERMRVSIEEENPALFAGVVGVDDVTARASAVIRGFIGTNPTQNAGLVVLERLDCEAIVASGGLASVLVKGSFSADGKARPGIIQVDTKALASPGGNCSNAGGNPPAKYAVFGGTLNPAADRPGRPSVEAQAIGGVPGRLDMFALTFDRNTTHAAYDVPNAGVSPPPTPGLIASRNVVDKVFNAGSPGRITALRTSSNTLLASLATAVSACPGCNAVQGNDSLTYAVYPPGTPGGPDTAGVNPVTMTSGVPACSTNTATPIEVPSTVPRLYVNCAVLDVPAVILGSPKIVLAGELSIRSNGVAAFPNATDMVVKGCGTCTGGNAASIDADGAFLVNTGGPIPVVPQCNDNLDNDGDLKTDFDGNGSAANVDAGCISTDDWTEKNCLADRTAPAVPPARLVVSTGPITTSSSAVVQMCQTFVLMADGGAFPDLTTSATTDPTCAGDTDINGDFVPQPCPKSNSYKGKLTIFGSIDWVAPNQNLAERDTSQPLQYFEDLAVWTESSSESEIKGSGNTITGGIFFFPNAKFSFSGQASQSIDLNAQFVSRRLEVSGQGTLTMKPNPEDTVDTPSPYFALIR